ncbi:MAG: hypothetical protein ACRDBL_15285 [Rhabdaerophilum sp.]
MITIRKATNILLAALALGGASLAVAGEAAAGPRHHGHGHGFHRYHGPHHIWGGHYGPRFVDYGYGGGYRCRLVRRANHFGEIRVRRVCFNPYL